MSYDSGPLGGNLLWFLKPQATAGGGGQMQCLSTQRHPRQSGVFPIYFLRLNLEAIACLSFRHQRIICIFLFGQSRGSVVALVMKGG